MKTGAELSVRTDDAEVAACRTGLVVRIGPLPKKVLGLSAARADEFIAKRIGNVRIGPSLPLENLKIAFPSKPACVFRLRAS